MGKLINGRSKIFSFTLTFFLFCLFFVRLMFVPMMLLSIQRRSHGFANDRASMCIQHTQHTYIRMMTSLLEIAVYDRLQFVPFYRTYDNQKEVLKREKGRNELHQERRYISTRKVFISNKFLDRFFWYKKKSCFLVEFSLSLFLNILSDKQR